MMKTQVWFNGKKEVMRKSYIALRYLPYAESSIHALRYIKEKAKSAKTTLTMLRDKQIADAPIAISPQTANEAMKPTDSPKKNNDEKRTVYSVIAYHVKNKPILKGIANFVMDNKIRADIHTLASKAIANFVNGLTVSAKREGKTRMRVLAEYLGQTTYFAVHQLISDIKPYKRKIIESNKVAILLPGYANRAKTMPGLQNELIGRGYQVVTVSLRLWLKNRKELIAQTMKIIEDTKKANKQLIIVGYSFGGSFAHMIGGKYKIPSISMSMPLKSNEAPFSAVLIVSNMGDYKDVRIPEMGVGYVESFSETIPNLLDPNSIDPKANIVQGVYTHFGPSHPRVIQTIGEAADGLYRKYYSSVEA